VSRNHHYQTVVCVVTSWQTRLTQSITVLCGPCPIITGPCGPCPIITVPCGPCPIITGPCGPCPIITVPCGPCELQAGRMIHTHSAPPCSLAAFCHAAEQSTSYESPSRWLHRHTDTHTHKHIHTHTHTHGVTDTSTQNICRHKM